MVRTGGVVHADSLDAAVADAFAARQAAAADAALHGRAFCHALAAATDVWITALAERARAQHPRAPKFALVAVGGYGRGELAPFSDIDLLLVHASRSRGLEPVAAAMWYPIWDAGLKLGHAVRALSDHLDLAKSDLDTATALLTARPLFGDPALGREVVESGLANWTKRKKRWLSDLQVRVRERQANAGEVAYTLEPDIKDGHGGIRDAQSLWWAQCAGLALPDEDNAALNECYDVLLDARVALHRSSGRPGETLRLEDQDAAARAAGVADADVLMATIAAAGRTIAWIADETWGRVGKPKGGTPDEVAPGVILVDGEIELAPTADVEVDPTYMLVIATVAARHGARIGRRSLDRLAERTPQWPARWPVGAIDKLVGLLLEGHRAIPVLEALDQRGLITRMLPEWEPNRSRPQRNAYHRFTVDRHLWETAANAAELAGTVARPDLLVLGSLFHDIGKGYPGDHTEVGMEIVAELGPRLGLNEHDVDVLVKLVEHHLLLPDFAVRRDVSDPGTIEHVAKACGSYEVVELLHALTIADSKATGPSAWGTWKQELVADLVLRVKHVVEGGDVHEATWTLFPDAPTLELMADGVNTFRGEGDRLVATYPDAPGAFARIAGVLSLHGLDVVTARAHSDEPQAGRAAMAACEFRVDLPPHGVDWRPVEADLARAMAGQLAIESRLAERARTYRRRRPLQAQKPGPPRVAFIDEASSNATVLEIRCPTRIGILYRIARAIATIGLDVRHANVQTIGVDVVDTFYVRNWSNELVTDPAHRAEIKRAILHALQD